MALFLTPLYTICCVLPCPWAPAVYQPYPWFHSSNSYLSSFISYFCHHDKIPDKSTQGRRNWFWLTLRGNIVHPREKHGSRQCGSEAEDFSSVWNRKQGEPEAALLYKHQGPFCCDTAALLTQLGTFSERSPNLLKHHHQSGWTSANTWTLGKHFTFSTQYVLFNILFLS